MMSHPLISRSRAYGVGTLLAFTLILALALHIGYPLNEARWGHVLRSYDYLLRGLGVSWGMTLASFGLSIVPAIVIAYGRLSRRRFVRYPSIAVVEVIRSTPELLVIFWVFFAIPALSGITLSPLVAGMIALTAISTAYLAESIRAGIQAVPRGQYAAALASGLTPVQAGRAVVLPQAIGNMMPEVRNRIIFLFKASSLLYIIGTIEFFRAVVIVGNRELAPVAAYAVAGLGYFGSAFVLDRAGRMLERRMRRHANVTTA